MSDFQTALLNLMLDRAAEIGDWSMLREVTEVMGAHIDACNAQVVDETPAVDEDSCAHDAGRYLDPNDCDWHCSMCRKVLA
jgi:hypothetical protein